MASSGAPGSELGPRGHLEMRADLAQETGIQLGVIGGQSVWPEA